jgi:hypothetical protein
MDTLAVTSITNFALAAEIFFLAGMMVRTPKARLSPAWFWGGAMLALATSALLGGIDHGFVEAAGQDRFAIQRSNWLVMGVAVLFLVLATARQFFGPRWQRRLDLLAFLQIMVYVVAVFAIGEFEVVVVSSGAAMVLLLAASIAGLPSGRGSWEMVVGVLLLLVASAAQGLEVDPDGPLSPSGVYHVIAMVGVPFMYLGGQRLDRG